MNTKHYIITFRNNKTVFVSAFNKEDALILAQAVMINNALTRELKSIIQTSNISDMADTDFIA